MTPELFSMSRSSPTERQTCLEEKVRLETMADSSFTLEDLGKMFPSFELFRHSVLQRKFVTL